MDLTLDGLLCNWADVGTAPEDWLACLVAAQPDESTCFGRLAELAWCSVRLHLHFVPDARALARDVDEALALSDERLRAAVEDVVVGFGDPDAVGLVMRSDGQLMVAAFTYTIVELGRRSPGTLKFIASGA